MSIQWLFSLHYGMKQISLRHRHSRHSYVRFWWVLQVGISVVWVNRQTRERNQWLGWICCDRQNLMNRPMFCCLSWIFAIVLRLCLDHAKCWHAMYGSCMNHDIHSQLLVGNIENRLHAWTWPYRNIRLSIGLKAKRLAFRYGNHSCKSS